MNAILLEHQTPIWQVMYNPAMTIEWLENFLQGAQTTLDCADYRLHATPGDALIQSERGEAVVHRIEQSIWPWQSVEGLLQREVVALERLDQNRVSYAEPWLIAIKTSETSIKRDRILLRDFVHGQPIADYFNQHNTLTPELISLASEISFLIQRLAFLGYDVSQLRADDLIYREEHLIIANWWRLTPVGKIKPKIVKLDLSEYFKAWQERVDYYNLFMESFNRIGLKIVIRED